MALARKEDFSKLDVQLAAWCKALAHPARLAILKALASRQSCQCGELVLDLPLAQSSVSQHLKALKEAGLIQGEIVGPASRYCIHRKNFEKFLTAFGSFSGQIESGIKRISC